MGAQPFLHRRGLISIPLLRWRCRVTTLHLHGGGSGSQPDGSVVCGAPSLVHSNSFGLVLCPPPLTCGPSAQQSFYCNSAFSTCLRICAACTCLVTLWLLLASAAHVASSMLCDGHAWLLPTVHNGWCGCTHSTSSNCWQAKPHSFEASGPDLPEVE